MGKDSKVFYFRTDTLHFNLLPNLPFSVLPLQLPMTEGAGPSFLNKYLFHHLNQFLII